MKRFVIGGLVTLILSFASPAVAVTPGAPPANAPNMPSSMINGIEVPFEVLEYVQVMHQGYAVTNVHRSFQGYVVQADNEDVSRDGRGIVLLYDLKWNLIADKKVSTPVFRPAQTNSEPKPQTPQPRDSREDRREDRDDRDEGPGFPDPDEDEEGEEEEDEKPHGRRRRDD